MRKCDLLLRLIVCCGQQGELQAAGRWNRVRGLHSEEPQRQASTEVLAR